MLDPSKPFPASELWIIVPSQSAYLAAKDGTERPLYVLEEFPLLSGGWAGFKGLHVDLGGCTRLTINDASDVSTMELLNPNENQSRPYLIDGARPPFPIAEDGVSNYMGQLPELRMPLTVRAGARLARDRWHIRVRSVDKAAPAVDVSFSGEDEELVAELSERMLAVDLEADRLLGKNATGRFEITARGPLGHDGRFEILALPTMHVSGTEHLLLPDTDGSATARVRVVGPTHVRVEPYVASSVTVTQESLDSIVLNVTGDIDLLPVVIRQRQADLVDIHLSLALRRLRWALSSVGNQSSEFATRLVRIPRDEIEQAAAPALSVDLAGAEEDFLVALHVEDGLGTERFSYPSRPANQRSRFALREMLDAIRLCDDARLRLVLTLRRRGIADSLTKVPLGYVTRDLEISELALSSTREGLERNLNLTWHEPTPVTDRVVRFWKLWQLWEAPIVERIPDEARGQFEIATSALKFSPGMYRVELAVEDPWMTPSRSVMARLDSEHCADVLVGTEEEREEYIRDLPDDEPLGILESFLATGNAQFLQLLPTALTGDRVPHALRAILGMIETDEADALADERNLSAAMRELRDALLGHPETIETIADIARFEPATAQMLRRLVVELGILEEPLTVLNVKDISPVRRWAIWHLWAPLILVLDGEAVADADPGVVDAARTVLGNEFHDWLSYVARLEDPSHTARRPFQFQFQGTELSISVHRLTDMRNGMSLLPTGPLDQDAWTLANFDWLIRLKDDARAAQRAEVWLAECLGLAERDLMHLTDLGIEEATATIWAREPTADLGPLRMIPLVVGTTALVCRAFARKVIDASFLLDYSSAGIYSPREAFAAAPELFTRDLCVMDLLLLDWMKSRLAA